MGRRTISEMKIKILFFIMIAFITASCSVNLMNYAELPLVWYSEDVGQDIFDLDSGEFDTTGRGDLRYSGDIGSMEFRTIDPENGAVITAVTGNPDYQRCANAVSDLLEGSEPLIRVGTYLCARTNEGKIAKILILFSRREEELKRIYYYVWPDYVAP